MLKHIVFIKFKPGTAEKDIEDVESGLAGLPGQIPEIRHYEFGRDIIHSERSWDFALISGFDDLDSMKRYQVHPAHVAVLGKLREICSGILAVDFEK